MSLKAIGGIFLRLDANGNLTIYDASGTVRGKIVNGSLSAINNTAFLQVQSAVTTTSTTLVSTGQGIAITPVVSSRIMVAGEIGSRDDTTANGVVTIAIFRTTGSIPAAGQPATGTSIVILFVSYPFTSGTTSAISPFNFLDTGLTPGTAYNYYLAIASPIGSDTVRANVYGLEVSEF